MPSAAEKYARLFSPITIGTRRLKNRIAMPAVLPNFGAANRITDRSVDYYAERAKGGVAMIVSEGLAIHATSVPNPWVPAVFDPANGVGFARIAEAVERHDCRMLGQLWHVGRQQLWNPIIAPVGVSSLPDAYSWSVPHVMTRSDVGRIVEAFVQSAQNLHKAGFSGVELHGGHGYLITQFLSPWSNVREDEYGGDVAGRTRFVREIIAGIRATCGSDFIVGLKMPGDERVKGGVDPAEAARIVERLRADAPPDYLAFAQGNFSLSLEDHTPDMHYAPGPYLDLQKEIRRAAGGIPVMAFGRVRNAEEAERALAEGIGDFVGMGRVLVADPAFPVKVQSGRESAVRPCIFCQVCWAEIHAGKPMACIHNPELATVGEADWKPAPAAAKKRVTIVGAGVAGLEAAWIAAARGHAVTVLADGEPGGNAKLEAMLPGRGEVAKVYGFQLTQAAAHGVTIERGTAADVARITATRPDVVVLATGSRMRPPPTLEATSEPGIGLRDWMKQPASAGKADGTAVLFDFDHTPAVYAAADRLVERFRKVVLVTPRTALGRGVSYTGQLGVYRRLYAARVDIVLASVPIRLANRTLCIGNAFNGDRSEIGDVALFTWATPRLANDALEAPLRALGLDVRLVGDAFSPRTMLAAVHEGHATGLAL